MKRPLLGIRWNCFVSTTMVMQKNKQRTRVNHGRSGAVNHRASMGENRKGEVGEADTGCHGVVGCKGLGHNVQLAIRSVCRKAALGMKGYSGQGGIKGASCKRNVANKKR
jgi:hypothetical protein